MDAQRSGSLSRVAAAALLCAALLIGPSAAAHPYITRNVRVVLFDTGSDGRLVAYFRITLPLLVGKGITPPTAGEPVPSAPFTRATWQSGMAFWEADITAMTTQSQMLGQLLLDGHRLQAGGTTLRGELLSVAAHPKGAVPPFDTPAQAQAAATPVPWPASVTRIDSGYVLVDAAVAYRLPPGQHRFTLSSTLSPGALGEPMTTNMFVDYRDGRAVYYRVSGPLADPVVVGPGMLEGAASFLLAGVRHVLRGADHLLFLVCLVLGASGLGALAWRISGFTLGHSLTLAVGYFGLVPAPVWFQPAIDAAIAATILLAAGSALLGRGARSLLVATLAVGLIHGFGFAFSLRDLLAADGPGVWPALAAFNLGVEIAQLAVGLAVLTLMSLLARHAQSARAIAATAAMAVAIFWLFDRVPVVWAAAFS